MTAVLFYCFSFGRYRMHKVMHKVVIAAVSFALYSLVCVHVLVFLRWFLLAGLYCGHNLASLSLLALDLVCARTFVDWVK